MKLKLVAVIFGLLSQFVNAQEVINYQSMWKKAPIDLQAELYLPENSKAPYPVIVAIHSSGPDIPLRKISGRTDTYATAIKESALKRGYAVVLMDSFTKRNIAIDGYVVDQIGAWPGKVDAVKLIQVLKSDPRLDRNNFFFTGHSWGGSSAYLMSYGNQQQHVPVVKATVASAPGCHIQLASTDILSNLLVIIGDNDEVVSYKPCLKLEERTRHTNKVTVNVVKGMTHSFSSGSNGYNPHGAVFTSCSDKLILLTNDRKFIYGDKEITKSEMEDMCVRRGRPVSNSYDRLPMVVNTTLDYFDKQR